MGRNKRKDRTRQARHELATTIIANHITEKCQEIEFNKLIREGKIVETKESEADNE